MRRGEREGGRMTYRDARQKLVKDAADRVFEHVRKLFDGLLIPELLHTAPVPARNAEQDTPSAFEAGLARIAELEHERHLLFAKLCPLCAHRDTEHSTYCVAHEYHVCKAGSAFDAKIEGE